MIWLDANDLAILFMSGIDSEIATPTTGLVHQPEVRERGREGRGHPANCICAEVWQEVVEDWKEENGPGREES